VLKATHWVCDRRPRLAPSCGAGHSRRPRPCVDIRSRYASSPCAKRPQRMVPSLERRRQAPRPDRRCAGGRPRHRQGIGHPSRRENCCRVRLAARRRRSDDDAGLEAARGGLRGGHRCHYSSAVTKQGKRRGRGFDPRWTESPRTGFRDQIRICGQFLIRSRGLGKYLGTKPRQSCTHRWRPPD
jgi:hypothetical protein